MTLLPGVVNILLFQDLTRKAIQLGLSFVNIIFMFPDDQQWNEWASRAQRGNKDAYRKLLENLYPVIEAYLKRRVAYLGIHEDILQEIILCIHKALHTYDSSRSFKSWFFALARYKMIDILRQNFRKSQRELVSSDQVESLASALEPQLFEQNEILHEHLKILDEKSRGAFLLVKIQGYSTHEAAQMLQLSEANLRAILSRAYKKLRIKLEGEFNNEEI